MKICFAASSGGHLEEILRLKSLSKEEDFLFTEKNQIVFRDMCDKVYKVRQINRKELLFPIKFLALFIKSFYIILKEKPDVVISTGALATYPICLLGRIMGKTIIYIESFARIDNPSLTGKLMYKISDLFIVQWEELKSFYPKAVYGGSIF